MQTELLILSIIIIIYLLKKNISRGFTEESFISIVNHTFRTPLTRIKWMADTLRQETSRKEQLEITDNLENSANRLLEIVDILAGIKDVHNTSSYDLKAVSIREILEEAISKSKKSINEKRITLSVPVMNNLPLLSVDTKKISLVVNILLENAILYSKEGGNINIDCEIKNRELLLKVEDSGIGLSWKDRRNLFRRFYRGDRAKKMNTDGMGLGLYISKEIIRRHHGRIEGHSRGKDRGTTFYIALPISR